MTVTLHTYDKDNNRITSENIDITSVYALIEEGIVTDITNAKNIESDSIDTEVQCKTYFMLDKSETDDEVEFNFTDDEIVVNYTSLFPQKKSLLQKLFKSKSAQCLLLDKSECKNLITDYFNLDRKAFELKYNEK